MQNCIYTPRTICNQRTALEYLESKRVLKYNTGVNWHLFKLITWTFGVAYLILLIVLLRSS